MESMQNSVIHAVQRQNALLCVGLAVLLTIPALTMNIQTAQSVQAVFRVISLTLSSYAFWRLLKHGFDPTAVWLGMLGAGVGTCIALISLGGLHAPMAVPTLIAFVLFGVASFGDAARKPSMLFAVSAFLALAVLESAGQGALVDHRPDDVDRMLANQTLGLAIVGASSLMYLALLFRLQNVKRNLLEDANQRLADHAASLAETQRKKDSVLSIVSHELRTPASAAMMLASERDIGKYQVQIVSSLRHLLGVIDDLRAVINIDEAPELCPVRFQLDELIDEVCLQVSSILSRQRISLEVEHDLTTSTSLVGDDQRLRSILTNLIKTAALHSGGTRVRFAVRTKRQDDEHFAVEFRVADDGKGIPEADRERIFDPFERGDTKSSGTGVGLSIVKDWISAMGGSVEIATSADLGGAEFHITLKLPIAQGDPSSPSTEEFSETDLEMLLGKRALLVEDDRVLRQASRRMLELELGFEVLTAADGQLALATLGETPVDIIFTDYFMPNLNGVELVKTLRSSGNNCPIVGITAATVGEEKNELLEAGANYVLSKPMELGKLKSVLAALQL